MVQKNRDTISSKLVTNMSRFCLLAVALGLMERVPLTSSFTPSHPSTTLTTCTSSSSPLHPPSTVLLRATFDAEADVQQRLAYAKEMLAKSKEKLKRREENRNGISSSSKKSDADSGTLPFFAARSSSSKQRGTTTDSAESRRKQMIKATNDETGLVTVDGAKMAALSENEEWEIRSVLGAFGTNNAEDIQNAEIYERATESLSDRDAMAQMWNLKKRMKTEDYEKIFDKRNFLIGEDN